jgi:hypothetical protein
MAERKIENLGLKIRLTNEYINNGGVENIWDKELLQDLMKVKGDSITGETDPDTVSPRVNAFMNAILMSHMMPPVFHEHHISEYESTYQKSNSFDQWNIDTTEQFDVIYEKWKGATDALFRGQREARWRLYSNLQRLWLTNKLFDSEESYHKLIENMINLGKAEFGEQIKQILKTNHIDSENTISILGYLQHHGCPTPLLDWTYKFQNALYFGIDGLVPGSGKVEIEDYFSVYFILEKHFIGGDWRAMMQEALDKAEPIMLNKEIAKIAKDDEKKRTAMEKHFAGRKLFDKSKISGSGLINRMTSLGLLMQSSIGYFSDRGIDSGILFSMNNSKNILNQAGVFTWNPFPAKPLEMVGEEDYPGDDKAKRNYKFCSCFNINKKLAGYIKHRLEADGVTKEFIYPTPDISTKEVFEKARKKAI